MSPPEETVVDHINGDTLDNRIENLRLCTNNQNTKSVRRSPKPCGFKGVTAHGIRYRARVKNDYKEYLLGVFDTAIEAAMEYDRAALRLHGRFAVTNEMLGLI